MFVSILESNYNVAREAAVTYQLPAAGQCEGEGGSGQRQSPVTAQPDTRCNDVLTQSQSPHSLSPTFVLFNVKIRGERTRQLRVISLDRKREGYRKIFIFSVNIISHMSKKIKLNIFK